MDFEDAFTQKEIAAAGTDVGGPEEDELRGVIRRVAQVNEVELTRDEESFALLVFVGGRTYQAGIQAFPVMMSFQELVEYNRYLVGMRGNDD